MTKKKDEEQKAKEVKPVEQTERAEQNSVAPENTPSAGAPKQEGAKPPEDTAQSGLQASEGNAANTATTPLLPEVPENAAPELESLAVLADRHRVPTWQQAALCRLMGWADGKAVSNAEYVDVLDRLKTRRVGGGRVE